MISHQTPLAVTGHHRLLTIGLRRRALHQRLEIRHKRIASGGIAIIKGQAEQVRVDRPPRSRDLVGHRYVPRTFGREVLAHRNGRDAHPRLVARPAALIDRQGHPGGNLLGLVRGQPAGHGVLPRTRRALRQYVDGIHGGYQKVEISDTSPGAYLNIERTHPEPGDEDHRRHRGALVSRRCASVTGQPNPRYCDNRNQNRPAYIFLMCISQSHRSDCTAYFNSSSRRRRNRLNRARKSRGANSVVPSIAKSTAA